MSRNWCLLLLGVVSLGGGLATNVQASSHPGDVGRALSTAFIGTGRDPLMSEAGKCVVFRREFTLARSPKNANLHLFANSRYMLWVNGRYVERGPARFEPKAPEYDTVNIGEFLTVGQNAISVMVTGPISNGRIAWRPLAFCAKLDADKLDLRSDAAWRWNDHTRYRGVAVDWANYYDIADARMEDGDWTQAQYDDSMWPAAVPLPSNPKEIRVHTQVDGNLVSLRVQPFENEKGSTSWWGPLSPRRIPRLKETYLVPTWSEALPKRLNAGEQIAFRFPHLVLAYVQFEVEAEAGTEIELTYSPGTRYICREGIQQFTTSDTHAVMDGAILVRSGRATIRKVEFVERLYPFTRVGSFHSSDPLLNKLWTTCVRGLEVTSEDAYIDCTDRERVEWMDCDPPAFDVTRVAMMGPPENGKAMYSDPRLLEEMLRRTAYSLQPGGWVKAHTSSDRFDIHAKMEDRACDWIEGARRYYESSGRTEVIREIWPMIATQLQYFLDRRTDRGLVSAREWVVWGNPVGYQTCEGTALNAFVYRALVDAAYLGRIVGQSADADRFDMAAASIAKAVNSILWDERSGTYFAGYYDLETAKRAVDYRPLAIPVTNHLISPTRHSALFTLDQGIVPEGRRKSVVTFLMADPPTDDAIMQYYYYFKQQYLIDQPVQDLNVLQTLRREWKDMAESPYEATFEGLHAWGSKAHCYGMFPAYFLSSYVLGVRLDGPTQNKRLLIEPRLGDLTEASGTVVTEFGTVDVSWKETGDQWSFSLTVPTRIKVKLRLPVKTPAAKILLDGRPYNATGITGRWVEFELSPGKHVGSWG